MDNITRSIISGEKIQFNCDYYIATLDDINFNPKIKLELQKNPTKFLNLELNNFKIIGKPKGINLKIFCYTHLLQNYLKKIKQILKLISFDFVIYFHNSDENFIEKYYNELYNINNLKKIYAQNNTVYSDLVITLPIGQANTQWVHGNVQVLHNKMLENVQKTNEIFLNFSITTSKRIPCKNILINLNINKNK